VRKPCAHGHHQNILARPSDGLLHVQLPRRIAAPAVHFGSVGREGASVLLAAVHLRRGEQGGRVGLPVWVQADARQCGSVWVLAGYTASVSVACWYVFDVLIIVVDFCLILIISTPALGWIVFKDDAWMRITWCYFWNDVINFICCMSNIKKFLYINIILIQIITK